MALLAQTRHGGCLDRIWSAIEACKRSSLVAHGRAVSVLIYVGSRENYDYGGRRDGALREDVDPANVEGQNHGQQATNRFVLRRGDPMTGQQPEPGWFQGADGQWYRPADVGEPRKERTERTWFTGLMETLQELMETIRQGYIKLKGQSYDRHHDHSNHAPSSASPGFDDPAVPPALPPSDPTELNKRL